MASTTGDGAEQAEPKAAAPTPPRPTTKEATPAPGPAFGPPGVAAAADAPPAGEPASPAASVLAIPPVAVPKVRPAPARSVKGETTASDYVAPREIPAHTPRPTESVDAKVVIDVPDGAAGGAESEAEVVEMRQRRRAPTMKIDRSKIGELKQIEGARERSTQPDLPAMPNGGALPPPHAGNESLRPASLGIDGPRPLARARPEPRSARGVGWAVVALATVVVGGGVAAIALGLVPGLGPTPPPEREVASEPPPSAARPAGPSASTAPSVEETAAPAPTPSAAPTIDPSAAPAASTPPPPTAAGTYPAKPPVPSGTGGPPRPQPLPRPRPRSDIPQGI